MLISETGNIQLVTEEWAPCNYRKNGELQGFSVEIVRSIMNELGIDEEIEIYPSMRSTHKLNCEPRTIFLAML